MSRTSLTVPVSAVPSPVRQRRTCAYLLALLMLSGPAGVQAQTATAGPDAEPAGTGQQAAGDAPAPPPAGRVGGMPGNPQEAAFFEENGRKPDVLTLPDGVQLRQLSAGTGPAAAGAEMVVLNLSRRGLLEPAASPADGAASRHQQRYQMQTLPKALYEAIQRMHVGDRWEVYAPSQGKGRAAPGHRASPPLPAAAFTVEVLSAH